MNENITPILYGISPLALAWVVLLIVAGVRGGSKASVSLLFLGIRILGTILAIVLILHFLPNWSVLTFLLFISILPWFSLIRYFVTKRLAGRLLLRLQQNNEKWSMSILKGITLALFGLTIMLTRFDFLSTTKWIALGVTVISFGLFRITLKFRVSQLREKGILYFTGKFYRWDIIESYSWKFGEDNLTLKLKNSSLKKKVDLKIGSQFRVNVLPYLKQFIDKVED